MTQQAPDKINIFWFLPTHGDGRYLGTTEGGRPVDLPYLQQVALAADSLGYYGVLIPTGDQRRYRRRPGGKQRRRYLPQPQRALSGDPRIS